MNFSVEAYTFFFFFFWTCTFLKSIFAEILFWQCLNLAEYIMRYFEGASALELFCVLTVCALIMIFVCGVFHTWQRFPKIRIINIKHNKLSSNNEHRAEKLLKSRCQHVLCNCTVAIPEMVYLTSVTITDLPVYLLIVNFPMKNINIQACGNE